VPQGPDLDQPPLSGQPLLQFDQRQIGLRSDPFAQHGFGVGQARPAMAPNGKTAPLASFLPAVPHLVHPDAADLEPSRYLRGTLAPLQGPQHAIP